MKMIETVFNLICSNDVIKLKVKVEGFVVVVDQVMAVDRVGSLGSRRSIDQIQREMNREKIVYAKCEANSV